MTPLSDPNCYLFVSSDVVLDERMLGIPFSREKLIKAANSRDKVSFSLLGICSNQHNMKHGGMLQNTPRRMH